MFAQLAFHVGEHAAGHLRHQNARVHAAQAAFEAPVFEPHLAKVGGDFLQGANIQAGVAVGAFQHRHHGFGGAVAVGHRHGGDRGVDVVDAGLRRLQGGGGGQAGGGVALHVYWNIQRLLKTADQLERGVGREQAGHVLDRHGIGAHVLDAFALLHPDVEGMHRAHRVGDGALGVLALFDHRRHRALDVAHVVHGVEHAEHVHAAFRRPFHEGVDHVVGVMAVAEQVLPAQQHLLGRVGHRLLELADALPGVLAQVADAGVEGGAAPGFQ